MDETKLEKKLKKHILKTVGKKPSAEEKSKFDKIIQKSYDRIYGKPNANDDIVSEEYDKISTYWGMVVVEETQHEEILNLLKYCKYF